jgi:hypothetical protein
MSAISRLIDGHKQLDGLMRWIKSAIYRLIDGHDVQLDGLMRWTLYFVKPFDNVIVIARDNLCNQAFGHWKHPVFRQSFDNVTAIARDRFLQPSIWPREAPNVSPTIR